MGMALLQDIVKSPLILCPANIFKKVVVLIPSPLMGEGQGGDGKNDMGLWYASRN